MSARSWLPFPKPFHCVITEAINADISLINDLHRHKQKGGESESLSEKNISELDSKTRELINLVIREMEILVASELSPTDLTSVIIRLLDIANKCSDTAHANQLRETVEKLTARRQ